MAIATGSAHGAIVRRVRRRVISSTTAITAQAGNVREPARRDPDQARLTVTVNSVRATVPVSLRRIAVALAADGQVARTAGPIANADGSVVPNWTPAARMARAAGQDRRGPRVIPFQ
jgi:hypothetical protein